MDPSCARVRTVSDSVLLHRHGENSHFRLKTHVSEPFLTSGRSCLCTGAVKTNFVHKRGGFAKVCKTVKLSSKNHTSTTSSKTIEKMTSFRRNRCTPRAMLPFFFFSVFCAAGRRRPKTSNRAFLRHLFGRLPGTPRTPPGRLPDPSRTPFGSLPGTSRTPFGRLPGTSRTPSARAGAGYMPRLFVFALY